MPKKSSRSAAKSKPGARRERSADEELERALDGLLEEGIEHYDDTTEGGRRRMLELNAGFAAGEALLARIRTTGNPSAQRRVEALCAVIRYILHWAGESSTLAEPKETIAALRAARRALERASRAQPAKRSDRRKRGGAA